MKKIERYVCEICCTEYNDKISCKNCEKSHIEPKSFGKGKYISYTQTGYTKNGNYPVWIDIEFENGMVKRYKQ